MDFAQLKKALQEAQSNLKMDDNVSSPLYQDNDIIDEEIIYNQYDNILQASLRQRNTLEKQLAFEMKARNETEEQLRKMMDNYYHTFENKTPLKLNPDQISRLTSHRKRPEGKHTLHQVMEIRGTMMKCHDDENKTPCNDTCNSNSKEYTPEHQTKRSSSGNTPLSEAKQHQEAMTATLKKLSESVRVRESLLSASTYDSSMDCSDLSFVASNMDEKSKNSFFTTHPPPSTKASSIPNVSATPWNAHHRRLVFDTPLHHISENNDSSMHSETSIEFKAFRQQLCQPPSSDIVEEVQTEHNSSSTSPRSEESPEDPLPWSKLELHKTRHQCALMNQVLALNIAIGMSELNQFPSTEPEHHTRHEQIQQWRKQLEISRQSLKQVETRLALCT